MFYLLLFGSILGISLFFRGLILVLVFSCLSLYANEMCLEKGIGFYSMEIAGKVHLLFEQSGTFKRAFCKLGCVAFDYDIQNKFGQTDFVIDLFEEIEKAYDGEASVFDGMGQDDLIMAFFPCIYFEEMQMTYYNFTTNNVALLPDCEKVRVAVDRLQRRTLFHTVLYKLLYVCLKKGLRLIIENPASRPHYLLGTNNFPNPTFIDYDRTLRGDYFKKPTAWWFFNCTPTYGRSFQKPAGGIKKIKSTHCGKKAGICSMERSMISPDYARNFICDFILGIEQRGITEGNLFKCV